MRLRIRDFFQTKQGWIFAVSDYCHPRGIRSLLRYVPDPAGERETGGRRYRKMDFDEAYRFLRWKHPDWVADLHQVPPEEIEKIFSPSDALPAVAQDEPRVKRIVDILAGSGVPMEQMGITGSMLVGLQAPSSDIDFVAYGPSWWQAREILARAKSRGEIDDLDEETWRKIYLKRRPDTGFEEFMLHEKRKGNRGMVEGTYFDLLFTRDWEQIHPQPPGRPAGTARIEATVNNADFSFDSPAIYRLNHPEVKEIFCYSHTYAGQALPGERIEAKGVLEETEDGLRLVVGTTREARGEWIRSLTLMES